MKSFIFIIFRFSENNYHSLRDNENIKTQRLDKKYGLYPMKHSKKKKSG